MEKPREVTIRVLKSLPFEDQHTSVAYKGQIDFRNSDPGFDSYMEYVPMIEKAAFDQLLARLEMLEKENNRLAEVSATRFKVNQDLQLECERLRAIALATRSEK